MKPFRWEGVCRSCGGPSNCWERQNGRCRATVRPRGAMVLATGEHVLFYGARVEVCGRCERRYRETGTFQTRWALRKQSVERRRVARLYAFGWTPTEIANHTGIHVNTVRTWVAPAAGKPQDSSGPNGRAVTTTRSR